MTKKYMTTDLNRFHEKMSDFISFPLCGFTIVIKLRNFDFERNWNTLIFFDENDMTPDLNISHGKISDFVSFPLFGFTLVIKVRIFNFESHWDNLVFFDKKKDIWFVYVLSNSVCFGLSFFVWVELIEKYEFYWNSLIFFN